MFSENIININEQTPDTVAELLEAKAKGGNFIDFHNLMHKLRPHPHLLAKLKPEICVEEIQYNMHEGLSPLAVETLQILEGNPELFSNVINILSSRMAFGDEYNTQYGHENVAHWHAHTLQVFSQYPQLHPVIHEKGATVNVFAKLLRDQLQDKYGRFPVISLAVTEGGFIGEGMVAKTVGRYSAPIPKIFAAWVHTHRPDREKLLGYYVPEVVGLMKEAAASSTLPVSLWAIAERQIGELRAFMKPRGVEIA